MSAKELRQKSSADLQKELLELRREQFNLRMAQAAGKVWREHGAHEYVECVADDVNRASTRHFRTASN